MMVIFTFSSLSFWPGLVVRRTIVLLGGKLHVAGGTALHAFVLVTIRAVGSSPMGALTRATSSLSVMATNPTSAPTPRGLSCRCSGFVFMQSRLGDTKFPPATAPEKLPPLLYVTAVEFIAVTSQDVQSKSVPVFATLTLSPTAPK